jgi:hypothetical protein
MPRPNYLNLRTDGPRGDQLAAVAAHLGYIEITPQAMTAAIDYALRLAVQQLIVPQRGTQPPAE